MEALAPILAFFAVAGDLIVVALLTILTVEIVGILESAPVIGPWISGQVRAIEQHISNAIGRQLAGLDGIVGGSFSLLAHYMDNLWGEVRGNAKVLEDVAGALIPISAGLIHAGNLARDLVDLFHGIEHGVKDLTKLFHGIEHRVKTLENHAAHGIGNDVLQLERTLRRDVAHIENDLIQPIREAEATTAGELSNLFDWLKGKADIIGLGTFAGAIAAVIGIDALKALKCPSFLSSVGKRGCGLWNGLEDLLGLFVDGLILTDLCQIIPEAVKFFGLIEGEVTGLISQAAQSVCASFNPNWTNPDVAPGPTPPPQAFDQRTLAAGG